ncbi:MAG: SCO family protein [Chloroflexi bacterium]|nr:SCO family protein [Chloroflexota bacterium]
MDRKTLYSGITVIVVLVMVSTAGLFMNRKPVFKGVGVNSPIPAAEISMTTADGNPFQMSDERGKVVLLYFGFVNCPEECPLTMAHYKLALELLGDSAKDVQVVMVSTDPVRDTPQIMKDYLSKFDPTFIGIPGTPEELEKIWKNYGVEVLEGGETHSSYTYVIDRQGKQRVRFTPDSSPEDIASDLRILLAEN